MDAGSRVNQLGGNAHATASFTHRTFQDVAHTQLTTNALNIDRLTLVGEGRIAGYHEEPADTRERGNDLLDHAVGEVFLLRIAAQVLKRQHGDRRLVGQGERRRRRPGVRRAELRPEHPYRPGNVLDLLLAQILEAKGQPVAHLIVDRVGDEHPTGVGQGFDPRRYVDAVAIEVVTLDDHVAKIDANAPFDAAVRGDTRVSLGHRLLHRDGTAYRIDDAGKLHQQAITRGLDDATLVLGDLRIDELAAERLEAFECPLLVRLHQPRIPRHIGGKDRREPTFDASLLCALHHASSTALILHEPAPRAH